MKTGTVCNIKCPKFVGCTKKVHTFDSDTKKVLKYNFCHVSTKGEKKLFYGN